MNKSELEKLKSKMWRNTKIGATLLLFSLPFVPGLLFKLVGNGLKEEAGAFIKFSYAITPDIDPFLGLFQAGGEQNLLSFANMATILILAMLFFGVTFVSAALRLDDQLTKLKNEVREEKIREGLRS